MVFVAEKTFLAYVLVIPMDGTPSALNFIVSCSHIGRLSLSLFGFTFFFPYLVMIKVYERISASRLNCRDQNFG